jgi:RimJ/RimL family protein N-acetyltransferase
MITRSIDIYFTPPTTSQSHLFPDSLIPHLHLLISPDLKPKMADSTPIPAPFAIQTPRLIIIPSFLAIDNHAYRDLYSSLHRMPNFTTMAFGSAWGIKDWDSETIHALISREVQRSWQIRGIGDFGVGLRVTTAKDTDSKEWKLLTADEVHNLQEIKWIGYVGTRDATTTSMPSEETSQSTTKPWTQMIELRYGFHPDSWSKGYGTEAAKAVMGWCEENLGAERFIAETEMANSGSARILGKLGFTEMDKEKEVIWGMEGTKEWERLASR